MTKKQDITGTCFTAPESRTYTIARRYRHWEVRDPTGELVCLTVYKRGAQEVIRRVSLVDGSQSGAISGR